jgi:hypothetical protein
LLLSVNFHSFWFCQGDRSFCIPWIRRLFHHLFRCYSRVWFAIRFGKSFLFVENTGELDNLGECSLNWI